MTVRADVDLRVDAPATVVHGGRPQASITIGSGECADPVDGALRVYEDGLVVPGLTTQLHGFGPVPLDLGTLAPGWHTLTVSYTGGSHYECVAAEPFSVLVLLAETVTELMVPPIAVSPGDTLVVTVQTAPASGRASGTAWLYEHAQLICSGEVLDGIGTFTVPGWLRPGAHGVFAAYAGSETHGPSETPILPVTVRD